MHMTKHAGKSDSYSDGKRLFQVNLQNRNLYLNPAVKECWCRNFSISTFSNKFHEILLPELLSPFTVLSCPTALTGAHTEVLKQYTFLYKRASAGLKVEKNPNTPKTSYQQVVHQPYLKFLIKGKSKKLF